MAYAGSRLERIENLVKDLSNDDSGRFHTQTQFLRWVNDCQRYLSAHGIFWKIDTFDSVAEQEAYEMPTLLTDYVKMRTLRWVGEDDNSCYPTMHYISNWSAFDSIRKGRYWSYPGGEPIYWTMVGSVAYVFPYPEETVSEAFETLYDYLPTAFDASTNYTPTTEEAHDDMYVSYVLFRRFQRDYASNGGVDMSNYWWGMFQEQLGNYFARQSGHFNFIPG